MTSPSVHLGSPSVQPSLEMYGLGVQFAAAEARFRDHQERVREASSSFRSYIALKVSQGWQGAGRSLLPEVLQGHAGAVRVAASFARNQLTSAVLESRGLSVEAVKLARCGSELVVGLGSRAMAYHPCKMRLLCPICARRDAQSHRRRYVTRVVKILDEGRYVPAMLTLTVKDGPDLQERVSALLCAFRGALAGARRDRHDKRDTERSELSAVAGGVASVECKRGSGSGEWHPHLHCLVLLRRWVDRSKLQAEWLARTGDSSVLDIRRLRPGVPLVKQLCEVLKYAAKFSDLPSVDSVSAWLALRGFRLFQSWGCLWGVKVSPEEYQGGISSPEGQGGALQPFEGGRGCVGGHGVYFVFERERRSFQVVG